MKKLSVALALALAFTLPGIVPSFASDFDYVISGHRTHIFSSGLGTGNRNCTVGRGTWVQITRFSGSARKVKVMEGRDRGCEGWIHSTHVHSQPAQTVHTTGRWGNSVPVFRNRDSYYAARDRNQFRNIACHMNRGTKVKFRPFRDWGVGEVLASESGCTGWIDRGVVR